MTTTSIIVLDKLAKKNKTVFLWGDFNRPFESWPTWLSWVDHHSPHMLLPHIVQQTRIRNNSKTLTQNIYSNMITPYDTSGNLTATILRCLPKFLIAPDIFSNPLSTKLNTFGTDWSKFDRENFFLTMYL